MEQQTGPANYLRSSSLTKTLHHNDQIDPDTGKSRKERMAFSPEVTEEVSITLSHEKTQDLINRLVSAQSDRSGNGGVRISMYCRQSVNRSTQEIFDGAGILVYATKPPQFSNGGGSFRGGRGSFQDGGGGGGMGAARDEEVAAATASVDVGQARPSTWCRGTRGCAASHPCRRSRPGWRRGRGGIAARPHGHPRSRTTRPRGSPDLER